MSEQSLDLNRSQPSSAENAEAGTAACARTMFAAAVKRIVSEVPVGDRIEGRSELELLEAATAMTTRRR